MYIFTELICTIHQHYRLFPIIGTVRLKVTILPSSGRFEITENDAIVVEGKVQVLPEQDSQKPLSTTSFELTLLQEDIYKELNLRGYNYEGLYQGLVEANTEGTVGRLDWNNDWTSYIDTVLQFRLLSLPHRDLRLPTSIESVEIRPKLHKEMSGERTSK